MDTSRLNPATRALLADLKKLSGSSETALLEAAILHYYSHLLGKKALRARMGRTDAPADLERPAPSQQQQEVLSWLSDAFASEPVPVEPSSSAGVAPTAQLKARLNGQGAPQASVSAVGAETDAQGWALPGKPNLQRRRQELGLSPADLARESGLFEENIVSLEGGGLLWLSLQEQWSLASALNWSLEQLQEALEKNLL